MKFIASTKSLLANLQAVNGVVSNNSVLPILENFLFKLEPGKLVVQATDLESSMSTSIEVESQESGKIAVPARLLIDTLKNLADQPLTFVTDDKTHTIEILSENGKYKLNGEAGDDFPKIPEAEDTQQVEMPADTLVKAVNHSLFAVSNDELRPAMTGVFIELSPEGVNFVATDAHKLVKYGRSDVFANYTASFILPKKAANLIKGTLSSEHTIELSHNASNAFFKFGNMELVCRLIDARYPDYNAVIPTENPNVLTIARQDILASLKRIVLFANKTTHQVILRLSANQLVISSQDLDFSNEANERLTCAYDGADMEIGFNAKFLIEMLGVIDSDDVRLELSLPTRAGLLIPTEMEDKENILMLVMSTMVGTA